jgi:putative heme transporter
MRRRRIKVVDQIRGAGSARKRADETLCGGSAGEVLAGARMDTDMRGGVDASLSASEPLEASAAPLDPGAPTVDVDFAQTEREEMPRVHLTRRRMLLISVFVLATVAFLYFVLPQLDGVRHTWDRLNDGDSWWILVAVVLQVLSMISYIAIFQGIHVPPGSPISFRQSYQITMAGLAATRLFAAGGAGGVAVTAWALRRSGMERREVAERMLAFLVLLYGVYVVAMVICGVGLYSGLFAGEHPFAITIGPAIVGVVAILIFLAIAFVPQDLERRLGRMAPRNHPRTARWFLRLAAGPVSLSGGIHFAWHKLRHPDWAMIGTISWWGFNIAVLYAAFRAFGKAPPTAVLIQAYFVGMLANLLPLPGGIGGVDGGMIGAFVAFGVSGSLALIAVLVYRLLAFWLPSIPGAIAYFQLRRTVTRWETSLSSSASSERLAQT